MPVIAGVGRSLLAGVPRPRRWAWVLALGAPLALGPLSTSIFGAGGALSVGATWSGMVLVLLLLACAWTDTTDSRIPNWATYPALLWAIAINVAPTAEASPNVLGAIGWGPCLAGALSCFLPMFFLFRWAGAGGGDVKLATAIGALLGAGRGLETLVATYVLAAVAALSWTIWTLGCLATGSYFLRTLGTRLWPRRVAPPTAEHARPFRARVRLGIFFALGTLAVLTGAVEPW